LKTILIIDDQKLIRDSLKSALKDEGYKVFVAETGIQGLTVLKKENIDLILLDLKLPDSNGIDILKQIKTANPDSIVIMMTGYGTIENAVAAMKLGAFDYINKPFKSKHISTIIKLALETQKLQKEVEGLREKTKSLYEADKIIGKSKEIHAVQDMITKVSQTGSSTVLIQGESGTGKELVAKAIHYNSPRWNGPFIEINCSAIPYSLLESELFGYEQGAFTDAKRTRQGLFEQSEGGTLFLDEIGDMDLVMQAKLLNVLQEKKFRRLGGHKTIQVNARIIAATNHHLRDYVRLNKFREDLYYRLNVLSICLPPLRERKEDIILIAKYFIEALNQDYRKKVKGMDEDAVKAMINYSWPGNVRELRNTIERIMIIDNPEVISLKHLPREILDEACPESRTGISELELPDSGFDLKEFTNEMQAKFIRQALLRAKGNKTEAARLLNLDRFSLRYLISKNKLAE
jgi:DNA-binding NtrC family response regulator